MVMLMVGVSGAEIGEPVQVTPNGSGQGFPAIDGEQIVWIDGRHNDSVDIYLYDIAAETETRITNGTAIPIWPEISGGRIVWQDNRSEEPDIWLYDTAAGVEVRLTGEPGGQIMPAIDGDKVVWLDMRTSNAGGIYAMNLTDGTVVRVSSGPVQGHPQSVSPDVSGGTIVWAEGNGRNYTVFVNSDATAPMALGNGTVNQIFPAIHGDRVVWVEIGNSSASLVIHNLTTGEEKRVPGGPPGLACCPDISGDRVVWQNITGQTIDDVYLLDLVAGESRPIVEDDAWQFLPRISGSRVVWMDNRSGDLDVFLLTLEEEAGAPAPYSIGAEQNGENVTVPVESEVLVSLAENPSTGYSWNATASPGLTIADDRYEQDATPEMMVGVGGIRTWTLVPGHAGVFTFSAVYRRPWENMTGGEERFDLTITATEGRAGDASLYV